uniref:Uncharacterized protein n=1 Tax=Anguilla anguilla TaxID=7936 RepID=A0A0E9XBK9_ANGAN
MHLIEQLQNTVSLKQGCPIVSEKGRCECRSLFQPSTKTHDSIYQELKTIIG